ncbi:MAG: enolase [Chloroflexota bacterium]|nr:enolase [Chloroflexota bacterium]
MPELRIERVVAREILDSRGRPTVEADVVLAGGAIGRASVPSGASTGTHEAVELRDRDPARYRGRGVRTAVSNAQDIIGPAVRGLGADAQEALDHRMIDLDGTANKARLGANAMLAVSLAACRAAAVARDLPLYRHIADLCGTRPSVPLPMVNLISGGLHAGQQLDIQDVLMIPTGALDFASAMADVAAVHARLGEMVVAAGQQPLVADEGGWAPRLASNREAVEWVAAAISDSGVLAGIALDIAASHLLDPATGDYVLAAEHRRRTSSQLVDDWLELSGAYAVLSIEDGLAEDDWDGWGELTERGGAMQLVGDDLFVTNSVRLRRGIDTGVANAVLVKPNQAGTLTEALEVIRLARENGYRTIVSARSGETEDAFIADLAVGTAAGQIKVGSITRSERSAKWNQLLRIEAELGTEAYVGASALLPTAPPHPTDPRT